MFSGIVERLGEVIGVQPAPPGVTFVIRALELAEDASIGDSIAINGCCLTVVKKHGDELSFEAGEETLKRTNLGTLHANSQVNLERSLKLGDRLGGHLVTGHIDAVGVLDERNDDADWSTCWFRVPDHLTRQMASKGSIAVDGISLTLVDVEPERFSVALIPHTLQVTTLGQRRVGDSVNLETDVLAKYVERQLAFAEAQDSEERT